MTTAVRTVASTPTEFSRVLTRISRQKAAAEQKRVHALKNIARSLDAIARKEVEALRLTLPPSPKDEEHGDICVEWKTKDGE